MTLTEKIALNRRSLLKSMGWASIGLTALTTGCSLPPLPYRGEPTSEDASLWLSLRPEGVVEIVSPRAEIGQGISTALKQIVAEELSLAPEQVVYLEPRSDRLPDVRATVGSESMMFFGPLVARASAALAEELQIRAAKAYGLQAGGFRLEKGRLVSIGGATHELPPLLDPPLLLTSEAVENARPRSFKAGEKYNHIGQRSPLHKIDAMVSGNEPLFTDDVTLPDMLYARLITAPVLKGKLTALDSEKAMAVPGVVEIFQSEDLNAVIADSRNSLDQVFAGLNAQFASQPVLQTEIDQKLNVSGLPVAGDMEHVLLSGDIEDRADFDIDLTLSVGLAAHAAMEPRTAIARFTEEGILEVWTGTQDVTLTRKAIKATLELDDDDMVIHGMRVGGGFGSKVYSGIEEAAARLAKQVGKPVKLQWTREDEFIRSYHRPPSRHRIRARLNAEGLVENWWHAFRSGHVIFSSAYMPEWIQEATSFIADKGVARGALPPYQIEEKMVEFEDVRIAVDTGPWRGLGAAPNCWAIETAMDALAKKAGEDPLSFRLNHLKTENLRLKAVLEEVARISNWRTLSKQSNMAYGIACGIYKDMSYSASVAEVERKVDGSWKVRKMWSAHDCGFVVNPDLVKAQIEGNLMWGIGSVFHEALTIEENGLSARNFDSYNWASYRDVPDIEISLIGEQYSPTGAGETAIVSSMSAITNAVSALSGKHIHELPVR